MPFLYTLSERGQMLLKPNTLRISPRSSSSWRQGVMHLQFQRASCKTPLQAHLLSIPTRSASCAPELPPLPRADSATIIAVIATPATSLRALRLRRLAKALVVANTWGQAVGARVSLGRGRDCFSVGSPGEVVDAYFSREGRDHGEEDEGDDGEEHDRS